MVTANGSSVNLDLSEVAAIRAGKPPEYGPVNARIDQEIYAAMNRSAEQNGVPVDLGPTA